MAKEAVHSLLLLVPLLTLSKYVGLCLLGDGLLSPLVLCLLTSARVCIGPVLTFGLPCCPLIVTVVSSVSSRLLSLVMPCQSPALLLFHTRLPLCPRHSLGWHSTLLSIPFGALLLQYFSAPATCRVLSADNTVVWLSLSSVCPLHSSSRVFLLLYLSSSPCSFCVLHNLF